jgi:hypothetical protein
MFFFIKLRHALIRFWELNYKYEIKNSENIPDIDLWLVCHSKDYQVARLTLESALRFSVNKIRNIYFISNCDSPPTWLPKEVRYIDENTVKYVSEVKDILKGKPWGGWVLQQILKYSGTMWSDRFVAIDCDTLLLRPHIFFENNKTLLRLSYEHSPHYRDFQKILNVKGGIMSYTCHMMPFKADILNKLLNNISKIDNTPWQLFIANYSKSKGMIFAEWDLYARFLIQNQYKYKYHPWLNRSIECEILESTTLKDLIDKYGGTRNSISIHNNKHIVNQI